MLEIVKKLKGGIGLSVMLLAFISTAQQQIKGKVVDENLQPLAGATIVVLDLKNTGVSSDIEGTFVLELPKGQYRLSISYVGFVTKIVTVKTASNTTVLSIQLIPDVERLNDVTVEGAGKVERIKASAFEVEALDIKTLKNASIDINGVLATLPGVNIRQNGGLGANFNFSLNGFSGHQVRFFIDGIPQDNLGSSLSFNNFPATLIERVEVYKGVVPIYFGADALGGAINIITREKQENILDLSYDVGSFTTHRATLNGHFYSKNGGTLQIASFYNYSDNDYRINGNQFGVEGFIVRDNLGNDTGERRPTARRFHDAYTSHMVQLKAGLVGKAYADKLLIGATVSGNTNEIQHGVSPVDPFNDVETEEDVKRVSFSYAKQKLLNGKLDVKFYADYTLLNLKIRDTSSRKYDWFRAFELRRNPSIGETGNTKTLLEFEDQRQLLNAALQYRFHTQHILDFNYTKNDLKREGKDPARNNQSPFENPNQIDKHVLGLGYNFLAFQKRFKSVVFGKGFFVNTSSVLEDLFAASEATRLTTINNAYETYGYGAAASYRIVNDLRIKLSFEKTFRVPEGFEFFGDGLNLIANPELEPEESKNLNLGLLYTFSNSTFRADVDVNAFHRDARNFLFLRVLGNRAQYINRTEIDSRGIEAELRLKPYKKLQVNSNVTYINIQDPITQERVANIPYLYGNFSSGYTFDVFKTTDALSVNWHTFYTKAFPFESFTNGEPEARRFIPEQWSHNLQLGYRFNANRYHVSFLISNITNARLFDNLSVQKPGRAFYFKIRYVLQ